MSSLTYPEMRRLVEGKRVDSKIEQMAQNKRSGQPTTQGVARQSDFEVLEEFDDEVKSARSN